ncbi:hypothetical protein NX059_012459 [Plenodomus lindquistii]|nr:hypothetical protein NX059_012459 [Plenodomus lindquistii]
MSGPKARSRAILTGNNPPLPSPSFSSEAFPTLPAHRPHHRAGKLHDHPSYELLGESLLDASDDEAHTESITSTDSLTLHDAGSDFSDDNNEHPLVQDGLQDSLYSSQR